MCRHHRGSMYEAPWVEECDRYLEELAKLEEAKPELTEPQREELADELAHPNKEVVNDD